MTIVLAEDKSAWDNKEATGGQKMNNQTSGELGGIILAAGSSRRFGEDKRLSKMASGRTMLEESIHNASQVLNHLVVVLRFGDGQLAEDLHERLKKTYKNIKAECYCAPDSARGMAHSLANAIHLESDWQAAVIFLGDMPYLKPETIQALVDAYKQHQQGEPIIVPVKNNRQGHPVIFHHSYFSEIESLEGDIGAKPILDAHKDRVIEVPVDDSGIFIDVDVPEDLAS